MVVHNMLSFIPFHRADLWHTTAFEAGTLDASLCNEKVKDLRSQVSELDAEKRDLEAPRAKLELPAIDHEMLSGLVANFETVIAEGTNAQRKDLLRRVVKKILVHDRRTLEVRYALATRRGFEDCHKWLPRKEIARTARGVVAALAAA